MPDSYDIDLSNHDTGRSMTSSPERRVRKPRNPRRQPTGGLSGRREAARRAEQIVILTLALLFGLIGFGLHFLWFVSVVLMALLLGLFASELRGRAGGGVVSDVANAVREEAHNVAQEVTGAGAEDE
jgi:hypothetical protein